MRDLDRKAGDSKPADDGRDREDDDAEDDAAESGQEPKETPPKPELAPRLALIGAIVAGLATVPVVLLLKRKRSV